ncbi:MAG: alpha/beta hydrolase, partial [Pseudomonadales bacterium]|nr:alpha/beta hydrolase [Pseudomonadales bacterium]
MSSCTEHYTDVNGMTMCWFEWRADLREQGTTLLVHATGFHARCWDQTIAHLPDRHIIAVDMRGHGRSSDNGPITWHTFSQDLIEFVRAQDLRITVAAGHSMGGHCLTECLAAEQARFDRAVLVDPVILDPAHYQQTESEHTRFLDEAGNHPVAKRRNHFDSPEAMYQNFHGRGSFAVWEDAVLRDYCDYGCLPNPEGAGYVLACPPKVEATIYMTSSANNIYGVIGDISIPVTVLRAMERV